MPVYVPHELLNSFPFGVILAQPIRDSQETIINFRLCCFNKFALQDLPVLKGWYEGATLWDLFPVDARNGLFKLCRTVCETGLSNDEVYRSAATGKSYYSLTEPFGGGVLSMGVPFDAIAELERDYPRPISHYIHQSLGTSANHDSVLSTPVTESQPDLTLSDVRLMLGHYRRVVFEKYHSFL